MHPASRRPVSRSVCPVIRSGKKMRKLFSAEEDAFLAKIMFEEPFTTWIAVASHFTGRSARQCRDRWTNYLAPENKNGPWTREEDELLSEKYVELGPQWTVIAKFFDGRSENNVKNRWYTHLKSRYTKPHRQVISMTPDPVVIGLPYCHSRPYQRDEPRCMPMGPVPQRTHVLLPPISTLEEGMHMSRVPANGFNPLMGTVMLQNT